MKVHQNIVLDGIDIGDKQSRIGSNFCNEGKWNNFIKPLLPKDCSEHTFIELGTNAGLYLNLAKEHGYGNVIGYEKSHSTWKVGLKYRKQSGLDYKYYNEAIGEKFNFNSLPVADVILLANFHYHLFMPDWIYTLDRLRLKTCYCLVVSAFTKKANWKPGAELKDLRIFFREWQEMGAVYSAPQEDDPHPRDMYSILFKSPIMQRVNIKKIYNPRGINSKSTNELARLIIDGKKIEDLKELPYYDKVKKYYRDWSEKELDNWIWERVNTMIDVKENGLKRPILIRPDYRIIDGGHRLTMLREMGYKTIIARIV